jgi:uncharacterized protein YbaR (Trm112 family)
MEAARISIHLHDALHYDGKMELTQESLDLLVCPVCHGELRIQSGAIDCVGCGRRYPIVDGLPILIAARATEPVA